MKYFSENELVASATAQARGIDNTPSADAKAALARLVENVLDPLREAFGAPIYVNSGYRCRLLNTLVGGVKCSQHLRGEAVDVTAGCRDANIRLWRLLKAMQLPVDQAINEHDYAWIHISHSLRNRHEFIEQKQ
ncbi:MAG: D-Ala-D-Ala carboxypeptidase family metallohydrolase [Muribaculaceae bacterium]